jgi:tetratricopeptide (TPR) repeat protein
MDSDTNSLLDRLNALLLSLPASQRLDYLAQAQIELFEQSRSIEHLQSAIQMYENAAAALPEEDPKRNDITVSLATALQRRYTELGDIDDLDRAIQRLEQALRRISPTNPDRAKYLVNLGNALQRRNDRTKVLQDINRAIMFYEEAISISSNSPFLPGRLNGLGAALQARFNQTNSRDDLDLAIDYIQQAASLIPRDHPNLYMVISNLPFNKMNVLCC